MYVDSRAYRTVLSNTDDIQCKHAATNFVRWTECCYEKGSLNCHCTGSTGWA